MALSLSSLEDLKSQIIQYVPSCPNNQLMLQLSRAVREFVTKTRVWVVEKDVTIVSGTTSYSVVFDDDVFVDKIVSAKTSDDYDVLDDVRLTDDKTIYFSSSFSEEYDSEVITLEFAIVPYSLPSTIPSRIVNRYSDFFIAGAVRNIAGIPFKPYSNPDLEFKMNLLFQDGLTRSFADVATENKQQLKGWTA